MVVNIIMYLSAGLGCRHDYGLSDMGMQKMKK